MTGTIEQSPPAVGASPVRRPQIVIIGAGFGGLSAAKGLSRVHDDIIIDRRIRSIF
jgi:NADH dehydrogenase FAD-containing subunit